MQPPLKKCQHGFGKICLYCWTQSKLKCCRLDQESQTQIHSGVKMSNLDKVAGQHWYLLKKSSPGVLEARRATFCSLWWQERTVHVQSHRPGVMYSALTRQVTSLCKHFVSRQIPPGGGHPDVNPRFLMSHLILRLYFMSCGIAVNKKKKALTFWTAVDTRWLAFFFYHRPCVVACLLNPWSTCWFE